MAKRIEKGNMYKHQFFVKENYNEKKWWNKEKYEIIFEIYDINYGKMLYMLAQHSFII